MTDYFNDFGSRGFIESFGIAAKHYATMEYFYVANDFRSRIGLRRHNRNNARNGKY
jgi:hypothetical protein